MQARALAVLYCNKLGERNYNELSPLLGLPCLRQVQKIKRKLLDEEIYMPGINEWVLQKISQRDKRPIQNSMDGTRIIRTIELYDNKYLVGEEFPPEIRKHPTPSHLPTFQSPKQTAEYIFTVHSKGLYAAEAYTMDFVDITGKFSDFVVGTIPEAKNGVTGLHIFAMMMTVEKHCSKFELSVIGHCTDSASNSLRGLLTLATPHTYANADSNIKFLGLPVNGFAYYAPVLRKGYPSIAYPCWDHCGRTAIHNLMNENIKIVAKVIPCTDGSLTYSIATIQDLRELKKSNPNSVIKQADITPRVRQNCDATVRVISQKAIEEVKLFSPSAKATQLYLQATLWIIEPYRNDRFGSPPKVVQSLWAGIMTWRRWRKYVEVTDGLSLTTNWISRIHYLTLELMEHAGILHQLALFLSFPDLTIQEYSLRRTGNRQIESFHSILRGGASHLPITSANLTFKDFLCQMNKAMQVKSAENTLEKISGNSIQRSKKRKITFAASSNDTNTTDTYQKPSKYKDIVTQLVSACTKGDDDSKKFMQELVPHLVDTLKLKKRLEKPNHCLLKSINVAEVVSSEA